MIIESDKTDATITLNTGWNMVGPVENCEVPEGAHTVYSWNQKHNEVLSETSTLIEGVGYWISSVK